MEIRRATEMDWPAIWTILEPILREGETYALPRDMSEREARAYWLASDRTVFVAIDGDAILGSSTIHANQQGGGAHIANAGYITAAAARGRGIARALCLHSLDYARAAGFRAMQFNFVVSANAPAVHLWESIGFRTLARLPNAFEHPRLGFVDALVMWKDL